VKRKFRLTSATDFKRVRRYGKSFAHPLVVLIAHPNDLNISRFGISAGRSVGNAAQRNRAKRQLREIVRPIIPKIYSGWDIVILARRGCTNAEFHKLQSAITELLTKAQLFQK